MKNNTATKLNNILGKRGFLFYLLVLLGIFEAVLTVGFAISMKMLISAFEYSKGNEQITFYAIILIGVVILSCIVTIVKKILTSKYTTLVEQKLKNKIFKWYIFSSFNKLNSLQSGDVVSKFSTDAVKVSSVYANLLHSAISTVTHLIAIIVALFILQPTFTLIILACGLLAIIITYFIRKVLLKRFKKVRESDSKALSYISETTKNSLIIKAMNLEDYAVNNFTSKISDYKTKKLKHLYLGAIVSSVTAFTFMLFYAISVILGVNGMVNGIKGIDFGVIIAVLQLITQIKTPTNNLANYLTIYNEMLISAERLFTLIEESEDKAINYEGGFESLEVKNLAFSYGEDSVLKDINLKINKGDKVLIKGVSGEGKSTLLKIITGLYKTCEGEVNLIIDGKKINPSIVKGVYSYSSQDNMLFFGTIKENVTFNKNYTNEEVLSALSLAKVDFLSNGLNEVVEENGSNFSLGQGQRISLARAFIRSAPILILDEATSSLDDITESEIIKNIASNKDLTVIFVSHKDSFSAYANKTYSLIEGSLTAL